MERQVEQGYCNVRKYCFISLSDYIYVYICHSAVIFLSVCLCIEESIFLFSSAHCPGWDIHLGIICLSLAFTKLNMVYSTECSDCLKKQEDHPYSDVSMYFSIHLSIYLFAFFLFIFCLLLCVSI
jgi:hypothetical protein